PSHLKPPTFPLLFTLPLHDALPIFLASGHLLLTGVLTHKGFHHRCHLLTEATAIEDAVVPHPCHFQVLFAGRGDIAAQIQRARGDRKSTRLNSSHVKISYAVSCLQK